MPLSDINGCAGTFLKTLFRNKRLKVLDFLKCVFHLILAQTADTGQGRLKDSLTQHPSLLQEPCPGPHLQPRVWLSYPPPRLEIFYPM